MKISAWIGGCVLAVTLPHLAWCDEDGSKITIEKGMYRYQGKTLMRADLVTLLKSEPRAVSEVEAGDSLIVPAFGLSAVGGGLIGWQLGASLSGGKADWGLAAIGVGVSGLGIYLGSKVDRHYKAAIDIFNDRGNARGNMTSSGGVFFYAAPNTLVASVRF